MRPLHLLSLAPLFFSAFAYAADRPAVPVSPTPQPARPRGPDIPIGDFTVGEIRMIRASSGGTLPPYDYLHNYIRGLSGFYDLPWVAFNITDDVPARVQVIGYNEGGRRILIETPEQLRAYYGTRITDAQIAQIMARMGFVNHVLARGGDIFAPQQQSWNEYMRAVTVAQAQAIAARMQPMPPLPVTATPPVRPPFALPPVLPTTVPPAAAIPFVRPPLLPAYQPTPLPASVVPPTLNFPAPR